MGDAGHMRGAKSCHTSGATPCARPERGTKVQPVRSRGTADANQGKGQPKPETRPGMPPTQGRKSALSAAGAGAAPWLAQCPGTNAGRAARRNAARARWSARPPAPSPHKGLASAPVFLHKPLAKPRALVYDSPMRTTNHATPYSVDRIRTIPGSLTAPHPKRRGSEAGRNRARLEIELRFIARTWVRIPPSPPPTNNLLIRQEVFVFQGLFCLLPTATTKVFTPEA